MSLIYWNFKLECDENESQCPYYRVTVQWTVIRRTEYPTYNN